MTQTRGVGSWYAVDSETGVWREGEFTTQESARLACDDWRITTGHLHKARTMDGHISAAPFNIAVYDAATLDATPTKRQGDDLDVSQYVDNLIKTLFDNNRMDDRERSDCHEILLSLHGSTYANEWFNSTWWDWNNKSYKPTDRKEYTIIAFTRHELKFTGDTPFDAFAQAEYFIANAQSAVEVRENNTVLVSANVKKSDLS